MDTEKIKNDVLAVNKYFREKYNTDVVFGGSYGFYLRGIDLGRDFHDIDVLVLGIDPKIVRNDTLTLDIDTPVHIWGKHVCIENDYSEVDFYGTKILVETVDMMVACKKFSVEYQDKRIIRNEFTERKKQKDQRDLDYIKDKYGIE